MKIAMKIRKSAICWIDRLRDQGGSAVVELAVVVSLLGVPLLLGTGQMGLIVYDSIEVSHAAAVGAAYGMQSLTFAADTTQIIAAARAEASDFTGTTLTVTPTTYYVCSSAITGTQYTGTNAQANAVSACTGSNNRAVEMVQVNTSAVVTPKVHCPGLPASFTLAGSSVMEVEQ
jgi:TadE-like protein